MVIKDKYQMFKEEWEDIDRRKLPRLEPQGALRKGVTPEHAFIRHLWIQVGSWSFEDRSHLLRVFGKKPPVGLLENIDAAQQLILEVLDADMMIPGDTSEFEANIAILRYLTEL